MPDSRESQNINLRGILRDSVISCRNERGDELLVTLRSVPISDMGGIVNTLNELVVKMGFLKRYMVGDC